MPEILGVMTRISAKSVSNKAKKQGKVQQEEIVAGRYGGRQIGMGLPWKCPAISAGFWRPAGKKYENPDLGENFPGFSWVTTAFLPLP
jgi:hypothetical protein